MFCMTIPFDSCMACQNNDSLLFMFWNLENFFDWKDSGLSDSDREFSSDGERRWTRSRFYVKRNSIVKAILWVGEKYGRLPDAVGFAEVENADVVKSLIYSDALKKYGYSYIHYDSPDPRGIDVALIYRKEYLECKESRPFRVGSTPVIVNSDTIAVNFVSRDILYSRFMDIRTGEPIYVLVNHHPSKYGGEKSSLLKRYSSIATLKNICDSLLSISSGKIVAMGDFNDSPDSGVFSMMEGTLYLAVEGPGGGGCGTIKFKGKWELIDLFFVSHGLADISGYNICNIPFLMEHDKAFSGKKTKRTYLGPRYYGGVSDHCPTVLFVNYVHNKRNNK